MKITTRSFKSVELEAVSIRCELPVDYGDEDMPSNYPHRKGDLWDVTIDIETGQIRNWPITGVAPLDLYMKVVDGGSYYLLGADDTVLASIEGDYVPDDAIPGEWGDYVDFKIDANGKITNWECSPKGITNEFFADNAD